jgi:hypothetical protein
LSNVERSISRQRISGTAWPLRVDVAAGNIAPQHRPAIVDQLEQSGPLRLTRGGEPRESQGDDISPEDVLDPDDGGGCEAPELASASSRITNRMKSALARLGAPGIQATHM